MISNDAYLALFCIGIFRFLPCCIESCRAV